MGADVRHLSSRHVDHPRAVGRRIKEARQAKGLSQRSIAFEGCSPGYISRIEAGQRVPSLQVLRELAKRLDTSADYLATGTVRPGDVMLVDAEIALRMEDLETAEAEFRRALIEAVDDRARSAAVEGLGEIALRRGDERLAIRLFEESLDLDGALPENRPALAEGLSRAHSSLGEDAQSLALLKRCAQHYREVGDPVQCIRFAVLLGCALIETGDLEAAADSIADAVERGRNIADPYARSRLYRSQSQMLAARGKNALADHYARKTLDTLRAAQDSYAIANALQTLASICRQLDRAKDAVELLGEGAPLIEASGTTANIARYRLEQARALLACGQKEKAASITADVAATIGSNGDGEAQLTLGEIFDGLGDQERAVAVYRRAIELLEERPPSRSLTRGYKRLAHLLKRGGRRDEALELLERALGMHEVPEPGHITKPRAEAAQAG
jgi:tetratricopeptide (TPR) repeat protein